MENQWSVISFSVVGGRHMCFFPIHNTPNFTRPLSAESGIAFIVKEILCRDRSILFGKPQGSPHSIPALPSHYQCRFPGDFMEILRRIPRIPVLAADQRVPLETAPRCQSHGLWTESLLASRHLIGFPRV